MCVLLEEFHNLLVEKLDKVNLESFDTCRLKESTNGEFEKKT